MYLNKFFDTTYDLNIKDVSSYFYQIAGEFRHNSNINPVIIGLAKYLRFSLRECNQLAGVIKDGLFIKGEIDEEIWIAENIFYPMIAALRISDAQKCRNFLGGRSVDYLDNMYGEVKEIEQSMNKGRKRSDKEKLLKVYQKLFCQDGGNSNIQKARSELKNLLYD